MHSNNNNQNTANAKGIPETENEYFKNISLNHLEIQESKDENENTQLILNLRLSFYTYKRDFSEYEKFLLENIRITISQIFSLTQHLSSHLLNDDIKTELAAEYIILLSSLGDSFADAFEAVQMDFKHLRKSQSEVSK